VKEKVILEKDISLNSSINVKLLKKRVPIIITIIASILFVVFVLLFYPVLNDYFNIPNLNVKHEILSKYYHNTIMYFGILISSMVLSVIGIIVSMLAKTEKLGLVNVFLFVLSIGFMFLAIIALVPD
jgi:magnesium-transporting ATPase (P-type)